MKALLLAGLLLTVPLPAMAQSWWVYENHYDACASMETLFPGLGMDTPSDLVTGLLTEGDPTTWENYYDGGGAIEGVLIKTTVNGEQRSIPIFPNHSLCIGYKAFLDNGTNL
jgi:hypothetical protein